MTINNAKLISSSIDLAAVDRQHELVSRPLLKWAGGKTQLLQELLPKLPKKYGRFIEPFFGGGALFFAVKPSAGVIADSNPELINLYQSVASSVDNVIAYLTKHKNTEEEFYNVRAQDWTVKNLFAIKNKKDITI